VRELRDHLGILVDDRMRGWWIERDARARNTVAMEWADAFECVSQKRLVVERFCNGRRRCRFLYDQRRWWRGLRLDRWRRFRNDALPFGDHLLQVLEWR